MKQFKSVKTMAFNSKYLSSQIEQRLLQGYYDDIIAAGIGGGVIQEGEFGKNEVDLKLAKLLKSEEGGAGAQIGGRIYLGHIDNVSIDLGSEDEQIDEIDPFKSIEYIANNISNWSLVKSESAQYLLGELRKISKYGESYNPDILTFVLESSKALNVNSFMFCISNGTQQTQIYLDTYTNYFFSIAELEYVSISMPGYDVSIKLDPNNAQYKKATNGEKNNVIEYEVERVNYSESLKPLFEEIKNDESKRKSLFNTISKYIRSVYTKNGQKQINDKYIPYSYNKFVLHISNGHDNVQLNGEYSYAQMSTNVLEMITINVPQEYFRVFLSPNNLQIINDYMDEESDLGGGACGCINITLSTDFYEYGYEDQGIVDSINNVYKSIYDTVIEYLDSRNFNYKSPNPNDMPKSVTVIVFDTHNPITYVQWSGHVSINNMTSSPSGTQNNIAIILEYARIYKAVIGSSSCQVYKMEMTKFNP